MYDESDLDHIIYREQEPPFVKINWDESSDIEEIYKTEFVFYSDLNTKKYVTNIQMTVYLFKLLPSQLEEVYTYYLSVIVEGA